MEQGLFILQRAQGASQSQTDPEFGVQERALPTQGWQAQGFPPKMGLAIRLRGRRHGLYPHTHNKGMQREGAPQGVVHGV